MLLQETVASARRPLQGIALRTGQRSDASPPRKGQVAGQACGTGYLFTAFRSVSTKLDQAHPPRRTASDNVGGNKYRLLAKVWFPGQAVWIKFIGTHREYDAVDVKEL